MSFQYAPLEQFQLRLLTLLPGAFQDPLTVLLTPHCFLPTDNILPKYEALSYTWGDEIEAEPINISQNDCQKKKLVGPSLATALRHLRRGDQPRTLWIDALCINQEDLAERASQVLRMGEIYREADRVVVWLGPEEDNSAVAMRILDHIGSNVHFDSGRYEISPLPGSNKELGNPPSILSYSQAEWLAIKKLFARSWFKRLWVRQEIVLAKPSALVLAGHSATTWSNFGQAAGCIEVKIALGATDGPFSTRFFNNLSNIVALYRTTLFKHPVALLSFTRPCLCKDDRDRVYSLLGMIDSCYKIRPDYSRSVQDVCKEFMFQIYRKDTRLDILAFCDITANPTWIPNLPGWNPANHFWRNFATGYFTAPFRSTQSGEVQVTATRCGVISHVIEHIPKGSTDDEVKQQVKSILKRQLGRDSAQWEDGSTVRLTQALLGGHWFENTNHRNDPPLREAMSVFKAWVDEDIDRASHSNILMDLLVDWAVLYALSGWSVYRTTSGLFGICSNMCSRDDQIFAVLGCKDPIILRKSEDLGYFRIVGPTYIYNFSCGQAVLGNKMPSPSFVDSFDSPHLYCKGEGGLQAEVSVALQPIDRPYDIEDDHPLWHGSKTCFGGDPTALVTGIEMLHGRGINLEEIILR